MRLPSSRTASGSAHGEHALDARRVGSGEHGQCLLRHVGEGGRTDVGGGGPASVLPGGPLPDGSFGEEGEVRHPPSSSSSTTTTTTTPASSSPVVALEEVDGEEGSGHPQRQGEQAVEDVGRDGGRRGGRGEATEAALGAFLLIVPSIIIFAASARAAGGAAIGAAIGAARAAAIHRQGQYQQHGRVQSREHEASHPARYCSPNDEGSEGDVDHDSTHPGEGRLDGAAAHDASPFFARCGSADEEEVRWRWRWRWRRRRRWQRRGRKKVWGVDGLGGGRSEAKL